MIEQIVVCYWRKQFLPWSSTKAWQIHSVQIQFHMRNITPVKVSSVSMCARWHPSRAWGMGLWATWSSCRCLQLIHVYPCLLQESWTTWPLSVPSNSNDSMIPWHGEMCRCCPRKVTQYICCRPMHPIHCSVSQEREGRWLSNTQEGGFEVFSP